MVSPGLPLFFWAVLRLVHFVYGVFLGVGHLKGTTRNTELSPAIRQKFPSCVAFSFPSEIITVDLILLTAKCCANYGVTELVFYDTAGNAKKLDPFCACPSPCRVRFLEARDSMQPALEALSFSARERNIKDVELLITAGQQVCLRGFPCWLLRTAELGRVNCVSPETIREALVHYATSEQRLGK